MEKRCIPQRIDIINNRSNLKALTKTKIKAKALQGLAHE